MKKISKETQEQAIKMAKGTQRQNQTKEQTKLISQGIAKGIAEFKKQQSKKSRDRDKARKVKVATVVDNIEVSEVNYTRLPWFLLLVSWIGFLVVLFT